MSTFTTLEMDVIRWAEDRKIIPNSNPLAQLSKTIEEVDELADALQANDVDEIKDAYGDILVTLIIGASLANVDLIECLEGAYNQIKHRKGYLNKDGVFVKVASSEQQP